MTAAGRLSTAPSREACGRRLYAVAVALTLLVLWGLTHRYEGLVRDGELYALQALARLHHPLAGDLYLQYTSQDRYTFFSPLYAALMQLVGLRCAGVALFVLSYAAFMTCAWLLARRFFGPQCASASLIILITLPGYYGAYGIFAYTEGFLTARSLAEAAVVAALTLHHYGHRQKALVVAMLSMGIHPLMTVPGVITLLCLRVRGWSAFGLLAAGIATALGFAVSAVDSMDPGWLEVVQERSQFLFLAYWREGDWEIAARPFAVLLLTALVLRETQVQRLCVIVAAVGLSGLAIALIGGTLGPSALLVQGQAWRWEWLATFACLLFLVPTARCAWNAASTGPVVAVLSLLAWTLEPNYGLACACGAVLLWLARPHVGTRAGHYLRWVAWALAPLLFAQAAADVADWVQHRALPPGTADSLLETIRSNRAVSLVPAAIALTVVTGLRYTRSNAHLGAVVVVLLIAAGFTVPDALQPGTTAGSPAEIAEFKEWRDAIPADSSVLILPPKKSAAFVWFTLMRPSYLSVDQSSGVVFSRATAAEVRRRSDVMAPMGPADWRILSQFNAKRDGLKQLPTPALTAQSLQRICSDHKLGFVVAENDVGLAPIKQTHLGPWRNWNLYDCERIRSPGPGA